MHSCITAVLAFALATTPFVVQGNDTVYFASHSISTGAAAEVDVQQLGFHLVSVRPAPKGRQDVLLRTLWTRHTVAGREAQNLSDLDPGNAAHKVLLDAVATGFQATLSDTGDVGALHEANPQAWTVLSAALPAAAPSGLSGEQLLGLFPVLLPPTLKIGQSLVRTEQSQADGPLELRMQVVGVTPAAVLMTVSLRGKGIRGEGRQAVQRSDGMPVEVRITLQREGSGPVPAITHRVHVADMAYEPMLDLAIDEGMYASLLSSTREQLARPPYSAPSPQAGEYALPATAVGELETWMVGEDALEAYESGMRFAMRPEPTALRPLLNIGVDGRLSARRGTGSDSADPALTVRLRGVQVLDREGGVIEGVQPQPVLHRLMWPERYRVAENAPGFPFRLPLTATRDAMERIHDIRMTVDAEVYRWDGAEQISLDAPSRRNPALQVETTAPHRLTVLQRREPRGQRDGLWTTVVPLDAQGQVIPFTQLTIGPYQQPATANGDAEPALPLEWEYSAQPYRTELAAARPIAALQLRHYRWTTLPRQWRFWMAGEDGKPVQ